MGAREDRGDALLLSPALHKDNRLRKFLMKHQVPVATWKNFPRRNGELVVGLPHMLRLDQPERLAALVRLIALNVFNRLEEK